MRKTRLVWGQDAVQIGDTLCNSETELLWRTEEIEKNFQIKIRCFRSVEDKPSSSEVTIFLKFRVK